MTADELAEEIAALRPIATDVIGFHELGENEHITLTPLQRVTYDAQVYANGFELARRLVRIMAEIEAGRHDD